MISAIGPGDGSPGRRTVAPAAELARESRAVHVRSRPERDLHPAARLLDEEQADLDAAKAHREIHQIFSVRRDRAGAQEIVAADRGVGHPAVQVGPAG